jgi:hypothetical protein
MKPIPRGPGAQRASPKLSLMTVSMPVENDDLRHWYVYHVGHMFTYRRTSVLMKIIALSATCHR